RMGRRSRAGLTTGYGIRPASIGEMAHAATMLGSFIMNRREFLNAGAATAGLALSASGYHVKAATAAETKRVGLIGSGWYGKADLLRLIQVAPVEVVSLCDVDKKMLAGAAEIVATRQASKKTPRTFADYREMLGQKDLDIVLIATPDHWHAL